NILIIFFVPKFEPIFARLRETGDLPSLTIGLIAVSHFLQTYGIFVVALVGFGFYSFRRWTKTPKGRYRTDLIKLKIPAAGKLFLSLGLSRFSRILGTLLHNGIPILRSLEIAKDSTGNRVLSIAIEQSAENITAGAKLA